MIETFIRRNNHIPGFVTISIKLLVVLIFGAFLYREYNHNTIVFEAFARSLSEGNVIFYIIPFLLMVPNWWIEILKWKKLTNVFNPLSWNQAIQSVLSGISLGIITPSRIGEYAGKLMYVSQENKNKAITAGFLSSLAQNIINIGFGTIALLLYNSSTHAWPPAVIMSTVTIAIVILSFMMLLYFNTPAAFRFFSYSFIPNMLKKWLSKAVVALPKDKSLLNELLFASLCRFMIYLSQYVILLLAFGFDVNPIQACVGVAVIFLIQSGIPLPPVLSILARAEIALFVFAPLSQNSLTLLAATFTLWVINLLIPALIGLVPMLRYNLNTETK